VVAPGFSSSVHCPYASAGKSSVIAKANMCRLRNHGMPMRLTVSLCSLISRSIGVRNQVMDRNELTVAVFADFENLALGVRDIDGMTFHMELVLKRLLERGRVVYKRAYCDWTRYRTYTKEFHTFGFEMIDIPHSSVSGKNSADIRMVVDAIDLCYSKTHIDCFALLTGDSDFSPLVSKLKENDKRVIGCGVRQSTSDLLAGNCDEFIYYNDLYRTFETKRSGRKKKKKSSGKKTAQNQKQQEALERLVETVESLESEYDPLWGSLVKQTVRRIYPGFSESYYGYRTFSDLLEDAQAEGLLALELDRERGNYRVKTTRK
jgi:uncharacterized protein (TIGR00288 family)